MGLIRVKIVVGPVAARLLLGSLLLALLPVGQVQADEIQTNIIGVTQGSELSETVRGNEYGGYELAHAEWQSFYNWYHTNWFDVRVDMLTQYTPDFGVLWGFSTGEAGEKFNIQPSIKLGIITQSHPVPNGTFTLSIATILGGRLTELPCTADYGDIGGIQQVNCRLAATTIAPKDTLPLLWNLNPELLKVVLSYEATF